MKSINADVRCAKKSFYLQDLLKAVGFVAILVGVSQIGKRGLIGMATGMCVFPNIPLLQRKDMLQSIV